MNNKLTFTGGERNMVEDDFLRIQQSNRLGLHGLTKAFSNDPFIVSGCVVTDNGGNIDVTAGYIFFNGELIQVDAQNAVDTEGNGFYRYEISTTFEAGGDKTYLDSTPRQTWEKKRGIATSVTSISGGDLDVINGTRFEDLVKAIAATPGAWQAPTYETGYAANSTNPLRFRLLADGQLQVNGSFIENAAPGGLLIFTLPVNYRPTVQQVFPSNDRVTGTNRGAITFDTNGDVTVSEAVSPDEPTINEIIPID